MIDNKEINRILEILENLEDEEQAVILLREFNVACSNLGKLLLNTDNSISNEEWKELCKEAQKILDSVVKKIENL
jgi:hypothetical protein